jgi:hypothetical protein
VSAASEALADARGWLCDNLSEGDAGKVCGMLSVVSRHITELEAENAELRKLARGLNWCTENAKMPSAECEHCPLGDAGYGELSCERLMRELRIEEES